MTELPPLEDRIRGALLGGAIGDALGAPIEFWSGAQIGQAFGPRGIQGYHPARFGNVEGLGLVTDDTQMTLFTAEGLIRANVRWTAKGICHPPSVVHHAYERWLTTQTLPGPSQTSDTDDPDFVDGWLGEQMWLYSRRAPGNTCLSALEQTRGRGFGEPAHNNSKGCGAVMRSAPFGLLRLDDAAQMAEECAALTHGHPTGQLASGALAVIVEALAAGRPLGASIEMALDWLDGQSAARETVAALNDAVVAAHRDPSFEVVQSLGEGWVADEALAIGVYCALAYPDADQVRAALSLSVSHGGDSDSTGSICGNILGTLHGVSALPGDLLADLEGRETIERLASDLAALVEDPPRFLSEPDTRNSLTDEDVPPDWWVRYPGW